MSTIDLSNPQGDQTDKVIQHALMNISNQARQKHVWLRHQNAIGLSIFFISMFGVLVNAWLYTTGVMTFWAVIILSAFWTSLLHELEHDLIHWMYFRKNKFMHHLMMLGVYIFKPTTINPWIRRHLHFRHHKVSGTDVDLEERAITNGERWGIRRLLMTGDHMLAFYLRPIKAVTEVTRLQKEGKISNRDVLNVRLIGVFGYMPIGLIAYAIWHFYVIYHLANGIAWLAGGSIVWPHIIEAQLGWMTWLVVVLIAPNILRTFCLHFISSNMHYYGDIKPGHITQQCQVMNAWWLWPLQAFCFNFGSTHAIHHFVVRDPFYLRQIAAKESLDVLKSHGVRFNDFGTFRRANRYSLTVNS